MEIQNTGNTGNIEQLEKIYSDVSEWLKFLELKHAGMLAAWIAVFVAIMSVENTGEIISIMTIICLVGISLSIIPFCPFLNQNDLIKNICHKRYCKNVGKNPLFYKDIFVESYTKNRRIDTLEKYKKMLEIELGITVNTLSEEAYIAQIVDVSTVATIKAYWFNIVATYTFICLLLCAILVTIA